MATEHPSSDYLSDIIRRYDIPFSRIEPHGAGLINSTWKVYGDDQNYILQRVNDNVFKKPADIDSNIRLISRYLQQYHPEYFFVSPLLTRSGESVLFIENHGWFRIFPFVENSQTFTVVQTSDLAYEAASQFGKFTSVLSGIAVEKLKMSIPDFHNLSLRFSQFQTAIKNGNPDRIKESNESIHKLLRYSGIVEDYQKKLTDGSFKLRVTHHDTKISNVLFDNHNKGMCVIDLDTVMPGYFFSDVGDMMRTYLCPVSEEEKDFSKIHVRQPFFDAIVSGYSEAMQNELTPAELDSFLFAGRFMIYMQALRFLTDYLNNDIYYGLKYPGHNFVRAGNQLTLLERISELQQ